MSAELEGAIAFALDADDSLQGVPVGPVTSIHARHPFDVFKNFAWHIWKELDLPPPTPLQYDICDYLQHGPRRRIIMAYRGIGKSWLTAAFVCWRLWKDQQRKIMVVSASKERADAFSVFVKRLIETIPELAHLKPRPGQRDSNLAFDVGPATPDQSPSVKSVGITGQLTGSRADDIIADDIEVPKNSMTVVQREKLSELIKEFDAVLKPGGVVTYLGTPQTEESLYYKLPERGYAIRVWPARYPRDAKQRQAYGENLAPIVAAVYDADPNVAWTNVERVRFSDEDLLEREASYGRSGFMLQFMLDASMADSERYPLKLSDLIIMDVDREVAPVRTVWARVLGNVINELQSVGFTGDRWYSPMYVSPELEPYTGSLMTIDPSGRGDDETGYSVTKMLRGMIYLRRNGGLKGGYDDTVLESIAHIARAEKVQLILIESNFGDGMFAKLLAPVLQRIYPCTIEEVRHNTQKERRIVDTLEPVMNQHRLVVDRSVVENDAKTEKLYHQLFYQLTRMTRERGAVKHDDRIETLAMAVTYWSDQLSRDVTQEEQRREEELQEKDYLEFIQSFTQGIANDPNYYDNF
ncbi:Phage DNA packaging [Lysobacter capsici AZ78]|uniref:Phage DNA packaging n=1 Tax=Lysobacter capsici AZ78 TaxID=1444315 RepID=A0A108U720_9GAMM|nr:phage terminase large subunit [Lysobacter capsici]KWS03761.1 Phage DNA packaging [Lysobacter capsici AZ78]